MAVFTCRLCVCLAEQPGGNQAILKQCGLKPFLLADVLVADKLLLLSPLLRYHLSLLEGDRNMGNLLWNIPLHLISCFDIFYERHREGL